jgi:hypothetical protein
LEIDAAQPPLAEALPPALDPGPGGLLIDDPLRGGPRPARGTVIDSRGLAPAPGPSGDAAGATAFDGASGRVRYAIPWIPERDWTVAARVFIEKLPEGRLGQVASAWTAGMDDPLRIVVDGGKLFLRIEAGRQYSTEGVPVRAGVWMRVAAVKAGARMTLYVDGEARASAEAPEELWSEAASIAVGGNPNFSGNEHLAARVADFKLWDRALPAADLK